jgi:hypothetical protein
MIDKLWVMQNMSPFGRTLRKSEKPPENWRETISAYVAGVLAKEDS